MKKLAIAQIVMGILVVGSLIFWVGWVSTGYLYAEGMVSGSDFTVGVFMNPGRATLLETWPLVYFALGLVVIGCGIAQFIKARYKTTGRWDKLESGDENRVVKV